MNKALILKKSFPQSDLILRIQEHVALIGTMCCMYCKGDSSISEETEETLLGASGTSSVINEKHKSTLIPSMNDCNNKDN